ncbi:MAG: hypothetical protein MI861_25105 [Pirellulales bacterium]|nr:hypothetical protein [Pirellulales bacterium]
MAKYKRVSTDSLVAGSILKSHISDPDNERLRLLGQGVEVTQAFIDRLRARGVSSVLISLRDMAMMHTFHSQARGKKIPPPPSYVPSRHANDHSRQLDDLAQQSVAQSLENRRSEDFADLNKPANCAYQTGLAEQWAVDHDRNVETLGQFYLDVMQDRDIDAELLRQYCERTIELLYEDADALVCLGATPFESDYPSRHGVHVATIAMCIGIEAGLTKSNLIDLGVGCLLHDSGMHQIGLQPFAAKSKLSSSALRLLADHPVHAVEFAARCQGGVSEASMLVLYQMHERLDGSGYPRGISATAIHPLARIAAVADAFVGLSAPRPHRLGIQGYHVMTHLLDEMKEGKFDPKVIRALLRTTSLYPIGSYVEVSNGQVGRVIRAFEGEYDRPTIEMWEADRPGSEPVIVNLAEERQLHIARSLPPLPLAPAA